MEQVSINDTKDIEVREQDFCAMLRGDKVSFFLEKWQRAKKNPYTPSLNFAAFFFSSLWFVYRKMFTQAVVGFIVEFAYYGAIFACTPKETKLEDGSLAIFILLLFVPKIIFGLFGNNIYIQFCNSQIKEIKKKYPAEEAYTKIRQRGGTSFCAVILVYVIMQIGGFILGAMLDGVIR